MSEAQGVEELARWLEVYPDFWLNGAAWMRSTKPNPRGVEAATMLRQQAERIAALEAALRAGIDLINADVPEDFGPLSNWADASSALLGDSK